MYSTYWVLTAVWAELAASAKAAPTIHEIALRVFIVLPPLVPLFQRLDAGDPAIMIDVPNRYRIGGVVDPGFAVEAIRFRQNVFGPLLRLRIEARIAAAVGFAGPDFSILVGARGVERRVRRRQTVFDDPLLGDIELDKQSTAAPRPIIPEGIELAARGPAVRTGVGLEDFARFGVDHDHAVAWPGAAAEIAAVVAHRAAVSLCEFLGRIILHHFTGERVDLADVLAAHAPDKAFGVERVIAAHRCVDRLGNVPMHAAELVGLGIKPPNIVSPVFRAPHDPLLVDMDPVRARQRVRIHIRHVELGHLAGFGIELADIGAPMRRVPDIALCIAADVMGG